MPRDWATCWVIWEIKAGSLLDWREREAKARDDFSSEKLCCSVSGAVSDLVGKASIHHEKVSLRVSMSFNFCVGGVWVKAIGQYAPGICPLAWSVRNERLGFRAPCSETEEQIMQQAVICCRSERRLGEVIRDLRFSSVAQSCLTLCDPMDCSTPGFPVHHQLSELA